MSEFLETLKSRLLEAQKRLQVVTAKAQAAQAELQAVGQEMFGWQKAVEAETKRESMEQVAAVQLASQPAIESRAGVAEAHPQPKPIETRPAAAICAMMPTEMSKTDLIRNFIRSRPNGVTPVEIWRAVQHEMPRRGYLYNILGRLKDHEDVVVKRKKYYARMSNKPEDLKTEGQAIIQ